ncbi:two-component system, NtrC family, response regulator [Desulfonatronum thiosulfatophilum]|uniref:Two-component system, NtrC family, response regulator n=1 Tax=Desulfonatronum thiosulfatophilum TaxID=617002 RepID=A0A1G6E3F4_9BACT|nr:sigma-54 dependent transcriptional regulator [Desulfonatronum thiosulfatophilum]SDB51979.1 two-component system, NtrC family, response regulator [Desulfonatronum thiosulfatophilum]
MATILIIDDDELFSAALSDVLASEGHRIIHTPTLTEGQNLAHSQNQDIDLIFLDLQLPDGFGMDILPDLKSMPNSPEIIVVTGSIESENAELAILKGAWDFITKSSTPLEMKLSCMRALEYRSTRLALLPVNREGIIGESAALRRCLEEMGRAAKSSAEVLFLGETGTGKEVFARALHANSPRKDQELVVVDCASLTETIAGSELFGYRKGAFTGAVSDRIGLVQRAHKGTLFLDEVSEMPPALQKSFLRVLESRTYRPLGQNQELTSNFRLVCASNRNLNEMSRQGRFREDLLFRIQTVTIQLPSLRERLDDLGDLVKHHLTVISRYSGLPDKIASPDLMDLFADHDWPGNVRELVNTLKALVASAPEERVLYPSHLPRELHVRFLKSKHSTSYDHGTPAPPNAAYEPPAELLGQDWKTFCTHVREATEKNYLTHLMHSAGNDLKKALHHSGLSQARLYGLLKKYDIPRPGRSG